MDEVARRVRLYAILVAIAAGIVCVVGLTVTSDRGDRPPVALVLFLLVAATVAQRFPIHLSEKTKVYLDATIFVAAVLVLPPATAMLIAAAAVSADELILRSSWRQALFNVAQTALYVGTGAVVYRAIDTFNLPPPAPGLGGALAIVAAIAAMHVLNTGIVAGMVAVQLRRNALKSWRESFLLDLPQHLVLVVSGVALAVVVGDYPWLVPLAAAPAAFVYFSLRQRVELRQAARATVMVAADLADLLHRQRPGHSRRVARCSGQIAVRLGLTPEATATAEDAARIHHLVEMVERRLADPGRDSGSAERRERSFPLPGVTFGLNAESVRVVRHLTERWDGSGSPDRLAGEAIPILSRVIAVADAYDQLMIGDGKQPREERERVVAALFAGARLAWDPRMIEQLAIIARSEPAPPAEEGERELLAVT